MGNTLQSVSEEEDKTGLPYWLQDINIRTELKLSNMTIDDSKLELFNLYLQDNTSLVSLYFEFTKLGDKGVTSLCKALEVNKTCKRLSILNNDVGDTGMQAIAEMLKCNHTITELDLSHNRIGAHGCESLCEGLRQNLGLTTLNLTQNDIQDAGLRDISKGISQNTTLRRLIVQDNKIKLTSSFCVALSKNETIDHVNISKNLIGDEGLAQFSDVFKANKSLKELVLSGNPFTSKGIISLQEGLSENDTLKALHLNDFIYYHPINVAVKGPAKDDSRIAAIVDGWGVLKGQTEISATITDKINTIVQDLKI
jgi:Ran GTPase-activating protein (RanGAP) involved in mRNA processing and transport